MDESKVKYYKDRIKKIEQKYEYTIETVIHFCDEYKDLAKKLWELNME